MQESPGSNSKGEDGFLEISHVPTVEAIPDSVKVTGGFVLNIDGSNPDHLKLAKDGHTVLIPQPSNDPEDPLNWSTTKKHLVLFTITWGAFCTDFICTAPGSIILLQGTQWGLSPDRVNQANTLNILLLGIGGTIMVPLASSWGRAPVIFWTCFLSIFFNLASILAKDFDTYYAMRALSGLVSNAPPTIAVACIRDMFFLHERARKIGLWTFLFIASPYMGPMMGNFIISQTLNGKDVLWLSFAMNLVSFATLILFLDETFFNRSVSQSDQPSRGGSFFDRMSRVVGIWQITRAPKYFDSLRVSCTRFVATLCKPVLLLVFGNYLITFAWSIGINVTTSILFATPTDFGGYGYNFLQLGCLYFTPVVGVFVGEVVGHFANDYVAKWYVSRHKGVFKPEARLYIMYPANFFMIVGLVILGQGLQHKLNVASIIMGWGSYLFGIMVHSVAVFAYSVDSYPKAPCDVAGWISLFRVLGGFSVGYFQMPWGTAIGYSNSFGTQAAIIGAFLGCIILVQIYGERWRIQAGGSE